MVGFTTPFTLLMTTDPNFRLTSLFLVLFILSFFTTADDMHSTGKRKTFYPSSLMLSHNIRPLIFFSDIKLMYLKTKLKTITSGPPLTITNNCSVPQNMFFNRIWSLSKIHKSLLLVYYLFPTFRTF